ncbi:hypothetical protein PCK1_002664 [Pneumocystis canis]|nr:hypothetical protein PCK1_002664 [Pneumocystis canis]
MEKPIFTAATDNVMPIITLLKCIAFKPRCVVRISSEGLKLTVEDSLSLQAHAFLDKDMFSFYRFNPSNKDSMDNDDKTDIPIFFTVSLLAMLECFNIMNNDFKEKNFVLNRKLQNPNVLRVGSSCHLSYIGNGHPFVFVIQESGMVTTCELTTFEKEDLADIFLQNNMLSQKIIMKISYRFSMIRHSMHAMSSAIKVSIRTDDNGVLSMQFMIETGESKYSFIDFRILSSTGIENNFYDE